MRGQHTVALWLIICLWATPGCDDDAPPPGLDQGLDGHASVDVASQDTSSSDSLVPDTFSPDINVCGKATNCSGVCTNLQNDISNCGTCGTKCKAGEVCTSEKCELSCQSGLTDCSGV